MATTGSMASEAADTWCPRTEYCMQCTLHRVHCNTELKRSTKETTPQPLRTGSASAGYYDGGFSLKLAVLVYMSQWPSKFLFVRPAGATCHTRGHNYSQT